MTALPEIVSTARLRLPLIGPDEAREMLAGHRDPSWHPDYPREDDLAAASMIKEPSCWAPRHLVRALDGLAVGSIGFYGPPEPGDDGVPEVEIGYGLVAEARGHGAATEAVLALLAYTDAAGVRVRASVLPDNAASMRVVAKCGFTVLRGADDEGNLVMARPLPVTR